LYTRRARAAKAERREHVLVVNARAVEEEFCLEERARERERGKTFRSEFPQGLSPSPKHREVASIEEEEEEEEEEEDEEEGQK